MRNALAVGVVLGMVGSVVSACSSSGGPATYYDFCQQKASAECQYVVPVCETLTVAACESYRNTLCINDAQSAMAAGNRSFNPQNVAACLNAVNSTYSVLSPGHNTTVAYSGISGGPTDTGTVDYLCESVFQGTVPATGVCTNDFECANGNVCTPANGGAKTEVCAPLTSVAEGASCSAAGDVCGSGDACQANKNTGEYLCEPGGPTLGGTNAACTSDAQCDPSMAGFCDVYNKAGCQPVVSFGGKAPDCELYGLSSGT